MMRCEAFEELLHPWLDGFLNESESAKMGAHAAQCPSCAGRAQAVRNALEACAEAGPEAAVPTEAAAAWRQAVRAEAGRAGLKRFPGKGMPAGRLRRVGGWAVSVAAGLLFLLGGARLVHEGVLGWPREMSSAPKMEMAAPLQSASETVREDAPVEVSETEPSLYDLRRSDAAAYEEYADDAEPFMGAASADDSALTEQAAPMAEAEISPMSGEEAPREDALGGAASQAPRLAAPSMPMQMAEAPAGQLEEPLPAKAALIEPEADTGDGGSGLAHFLLDIATFAMMSLPLVVAGGIACVILRRILRKRAGKNAKD